MASLVVAVLQKAMSDDERLLPAARGAEVLRLEAEALVRLATSFTASQSSDDTDSRGSSGAAAFEGAVERILSTSGQLVVTGMGKAGIVGQKISATLASTGTPSFFLHPAEALHGDLGRIRRDDLVLALSNSGETAEVNMVLEAVRKLGVGLIGLTGHPDSTLGRHADLVLDIGRQEEACPMNLAPTVSTTLMLALGDALAMAVLEERGFGPRDYARFHPAGSLGRRLLLVEEVMRTGESLPLVQSGTTVADALIETSRTRGRPGATLVVDSAGVLAGIFTDGDLRRLLESEGPEKLAESIDNFIATEPKVLRPGDLAVDAHRLLRENRIDNAPVIDDAGRPVGLIDVQDLIEVGV